MTRINTNVASLRGLRSMNRANGMLDQSMTRLSTGVKINSGKDNPSGLIAGETLRSQVSAIEQSIKNSNRANNVISTADSALGEIGGLLTQVRGLVQEGLNSGALSQSEKEANQLQIDAALSAINRISSNTTFAGDRLIDGSKSFNTAVSTTDQAKLADLQVNEALLGTNGAIKLESKVTSAAEKAGLRYTAGNLRQAATIEVGGSKGNELVFLGSSASTVDIRDAINNVTDSTGVSAKILAGAGASVSGDKLTIAGTATQSTLTSGAGNSQISLTRNDGGADATLGGKVSLVLSNGTNSNATSTVAVSQSGGDYTITIDLADDGTNPTATAQQIADLINGDTTASGLVSAGLGTGDGTGVVAAAASADLTGGLDAAKLSLTDIRADSSSGPLEIELVSSGAANTTVDVQLTGNKLKVIAGTNATVSDIETQFQSDADIQDIVLAKKSGGATNKLTLGGASTKFETGAASSIAVNDARPAGSTGNIRLVFDSSQAASSSLALDVAKSGDDTTVTVKLATNANGEVTSNLEDIATLLGASTATIADGTTALNQAIQVVVDGDSKSVVGGLSSTVLNEQNGKTLSLESTAYGSTESVSLNVLSGSFVTRSSDYQTVTARDSGTDIGVTINGQAAYGRGLSASIRTGIVDAKISFKDSANKVGETLDVSITGGGSVFQIGQEVSPAGQIGIGLEAVNTARLGGLSGKLYELGTGNGKSLLDVGKNGVSGEDLVNIIEDSLNRVSTIRGRLGSVQKNVIETNISTLGVALENISEARSQIVDTDFAEETANMTKAQILSQASISVLSIANQSPQQVLSLLG